MSAVSAKQELRTFLPVMGALRALMRSQAPSSRKTSWPRPLIPRLYERSAFPHSVASGGGGGGSLSQTSTFHPRAASIIAAARPAGPPPTTPARRDVGASADDAAERDDGAWCEDVRRDRRRRGGGNSTPVALESGEEIFTRCCEGFVTSHGRTCCRRAAERGRASAVDVGARAHPLLPKAPHCGERADIDLKVICIGRDRGSLPRESRRDAIERQTQVQMVSEEKDRATRQMRPNLGNRCGFFLHEQEAMPMLRSLEQAMGVDAQGEDETEIIKLHIR